MASTENATPVPPVQPETELPINSKAPAVSDEKEEELDASVPKLVRRDSLESVISFDEDRRRPARRARPNYIRRYSPSPIRVIRNNNVFNPRPFIDSSASLLAQVDKHDGIADLPFTAGGSLYLTTFPFTDKDVKKWSWLFPLNIEDTYLHEVSRGRRRDGDFDDSGDEIIYPVRRPRNRSPYYEPNAINLPSVYLSRALDTTVVPDDTANVTYLIVAQNRHRPSGSKLLVAESRKAAGIMIYYEALRMESTVFVGAVVGFEKKNIHPKKFVRVESLEEAAKVKANGLVGVIC